MNFKKACLVVPILVNLLVPLLITAGCAGPAAPVELNVSAGASMTDVMKEINSQYTKTAKNVKIIANFAGVGTLQKQIEQGAPVDIFISAGAAQMDALQKEHLLIESTRKILLTNKIVLIVPADSALKLNSFNGLVDTSVKKIAIGDPQSVAAGAYAQQTFDLLGITDQVKPKLVLAADVRQVLAYVESGDVDAGIVFLTDAAISNEVKVITNAPDEINNKVIYTLAVIQATKNLDAAKNYVSYLFSAEAKTIFEKYGFSMAGK